MADRVEKYHHDSAKLQDASTQKIKSELNSLNKWVVKHQYETLPDGDKSKLLSVLQFYYKLSIERLDGSECREAVFQLLDDFLKLPEGKLVTAKGKQSVLRWLQALDSIMNPGSDPLPTASWCRYGIADISSGGSITLMDLTTNIVLDCPLVVRDSATFEIIKSYFEDLGYLEVIVSEDKSTMKFFDLDGNCIPPV